MKELQDILSAVQNQSTLEDGVNALLKGVKAQINENVFTSVILPGDVKLKFNDIFDALEANRSKVASVLQANVKTVLVQNNTQPEPVQTPPPEQPKPEQPAPQPEPVTTEPAEASVPVVEPTPREPTFAESTL